MSLVTLLPHLVGLHVDWVSVTDEVIALHLASGRSWAACPLCKRRSRRLHGIYERTLADLPVVGRTLMLQLRVRRFRCTNDACPRQIFAERFPGLAGVRVRRTHAQRATLQQIGFALGGSAGARLAGPLGIVGSRSTILRAVHASQGTESPTPRALGVDDWARKRGQTYGTILVDLERHRVVDLLEDRTAASFATWLRAHPGVEVIARDRAGAYADGARQGAPAAIQVADRFHLLVNVGEALERVLARKHALLRETTASVNRTRAAAEHSANPSTVAPVAASTATGPVTREDHEKAARRAARLARFEAVVALDRQGASQVQIAAQVGIGRKTVRRFLRAGTFPERVPTPRRSSMLDPFESYLRERWAAGCHNSLQLWREIRERGFTGAASLVRRRVGRWRAVPRRRIPPRGAGATTDAGGPPEEPMRVPSARQARWFLLHPESRLRPEEQLWRDTLLGYDPEIQAARDLAVAFGALVRERDHAALAPWLTKATASDLPEFHGFAVVLERDRPAVEAALTSEWSSGQTEGQITKLKLQKRQLYGRAGFSLLRKRALRAA